MPAFIPSGISTRLMQLCSSSASGTPFPRIVALPDARSHTSLWSFCGWFMTSTRDTSLGLPHQEGRWHWVYMPKPLANEWSGGVGTTDNTQRTLQLLDRSNHQSSRKAVASQNIQRKPPMQPHSSIPFHPIDVCRCLFVGMPKQKFPEHT